MSAQILRPQFRAASAKVRAAKVADRRHALFGRMSAPVRAVALNTSKRDAVRQAAKETL